MLVAIAAVAGVLVGIGGTAAVTHGARRRRPQPAAADAPAAPRRPDVGPRSAAVAEARPAAPTARTGRDDGEGPDPVTRLLREAVNDLEIGIVLSDALGHEIYRNRAADAMIGTHVGVIVDEHLERALAAACHGERSTHVIDLHGPPPLSLAITAEPAPNDTAVATIQDVSERVRIDAMRTDFVANISHELRTPIGAIAVLAETLADDPDPVLVERVAPRLVDESDRAVRTIDDLLELTRIESSHDTDDVVDLTEIVRDAIARGRDADGGRGVEVAAIEHDRPVLLRGDRRQLVSAIGNLVENAVKYSHAGGVVQVRVRVDDQHIEVMVADQGIGIPQRDLDRIFERFYRVDKARSRETGGTGLGLAIVRHVATNHGGTVAVSSQEGEGSTFVLQLPVSRLVDRPGDCAHGEDSNDHRPAPADGKGAGEGSP